MWLFLDPAGALRMNRHRRLLFLIPFLLGGCLEGSTGPEAEETPEILLRVSGGFAGVDYAILVDGPQGEVIGESCVAGCDFEAGQILHGLSADQIADLAALFLESGIHGLNGTDYGTECCDQFHYDLIYTDDSGSSQVMGTSEAFPADLREAVEVVMGFANDVFPVVVDFETAGSPWPMDAQIVQAIEIKGDMMVAGVTYAGGCSVHHFNLVVFGGWMESDPVQTQALLSHDAHDDNCDGLIIRELTFDLRPLKRAYQDAYGVGTPGGTTLIIQLNGAGTYSSSQSLPLEYVF
jgi:hypothetical protein